MLERSGAEAWRDERRVRFSAAVADLAEVAGQAEGRRDRRRAVGALLSAVDLNTGAQQLVGVAAADDDVVLRRCRRRFSAVKKSKSYFAISKLASKRHPY